MVKLPTRLIRLLALVGVVAGWPATTAAQRFAAIGDYGFAGVPARDVAQLVESWNPDFVITLGDNNYDEGEAGTIDANIGQYYHRFIGAYRGRYGAGVPNNRFFPSLGNHDLNTDYGRPYFDYFTLPGNERYYEFARGQVRCFVLNSDPNEPDGTGATTRQAQWLRARLAAASEPWKLVYFHHSPYSSGHHGGVTLMRWPFRAWGASVVLTGHDHHYERLVQDGLLYVVNGLGGRSIYPVKNTAPGSTFHYNADYGAQLLDASADSLRLRFFARSGQLIDAFTLRKGLSVEPVLESVYPTPVLVMARVAFSVPSRDAIEIRVLDVTGREVARLFKGSLPAGHHEVSWSRAGLLPGPYFVQLLSRGFAPVMRTVVL